MEMMIQVPLDIEASRKVYEACPKRFEKQQCYANVYRAITDNWAQAVAEGWKVAYGYYSVTDISSNLLARHCFILNGSGKVIDPTIFTHACNQESYQYFVMYVFGDLDSYFSAIKGAGYFPALEKYLFPFVKQAHLWARDNGYYLWD